MWAMISTWCMSLTGFPGAVSLLNKNESGIKALSEIITAVEADPRFMSVGFGGLPDKEGHVALDAAFMDGGTLRIGAVMGLEGFASPFQIACSLSGRKTDNILSGAGAAQYAEKQGFAKKNLLTEQAKQRWLQASGKDKQAYRGHDTIGAIVLDNDGRLYAGTSTSGLFMKLSGRIGDSPLPGCGYYADERTGAAVATGLGEDIMKGCISYEIVRLMENGLPVQEACETAVNKLSSRLESAGDISVVAMDRFGHYGAASNIDEFSFTAAKSEETPAVYLVSRTGGFRKADEQWISSYMENPV